MATYSALNIKDVISLCSLLLFRCAIYMTFSLRNKVSSTKLAEIFILIISNSLDKYKKIPCDGIKMTSWYCRCANCRIDAYQSFLITSYFMSSLSPNKNVIFTPTMTPFFFITRQFFVQPRVRSYSTNIHSDSLTLNYLYYIKFFPINQ